MGNLKLVIGQNLRYNCGGKMLKVVIGHSEDPDSICAVEEVLQQCEQDLIDMAPSAGILFAAIDFDHAVILEEISHVFPFLELIGCTTDGEMSSKLGFGQDSLVLVLFCSDTVEIRAGVGYAASFDPIAAAKQAVQQAIQSTTTTTKLCIALPASYTESGATTDGEMRPLGFRVSFLVTSSGYWWNCRRPVSVEKYLSVFWK